MNLCLEYLIRSGTIQNLLQMPCSVFLSKFHNSVDKIILLLERISNDSQISVSRYNLLGDYEVLPSHTTQTVPIEQIFEHVVLPNYKVLKFEECPIDVNLNLHYRPINETHWEYYLLNFLNNDSHRRSRHRWLWSAFVRWQFGSCSEKITDSIVNEEQVIVRKSYAPKWHLWLIWKATFLEPIVSVASELVFSSVPEPKLDGLSFLS